MTEYVENKEFTDAVNDVIDNKPELRALREHELNIATRLIVKTNLKDEEIPVKSDPIVCKKVSAPLVAITGVHYVILGCNVFWNSKDKRQQEAQIYHALMFIDVEENEKGEVKMRTRKPELMVFRSEITHYGAHNDNLLDFREVFQASAKKYVANMAEQET